MTPPTVAAIQLAVADHYGLPLSAMANNCRIRRVARPRQVAMYLSRKMGPRSLPEIGHLFGGRDHTTVLHAVRQVERLCDQDQALERDVLALADRLMGVP